MEILYMNVKMFEDPFLYEKGLSLISEERRNKIQKLKNPFAARLSLGAGVLLALAFEKKGCKDMLDDIRYNLQGKPYLEEGGFYFNLSHSGEYAVCASGDIPMGIDLQEIKRDIPKFTKKILNPSETMYLERLPITEKVDAFYRIWTRKEGIIKWDGRGLRIPLMSISTVCEAELCDKIRFEENDIFFEEFDSLIPGYQLCVCSAERFNVNHIIEITSNFLTNY